MSLFHDFDNEIITVEESESSETSSTSSSSSSSATKIKIKPDPFGINIDRDTFENVACSISHFPFILKETHRGLLPIAWQFGNRKSTPFIFLLVQLGIDLQQFLPDERGGLITPNYNVLVGACCIERYYKSTDVEYQSIVDTTRLDVLRDLKQHKLFFKEDIESYSLVSTVLKESIFPQRRFLFLVDWDPTQLSKPIVISDCRTALTPLQYVTVTPPSSLSAITIDMFRTVLELGYKYYHKQMGFLYYTTTKVVGDEIIITTPFRMACEKFTTGIVLKIIDDIVRPTTRTITRTTTTTSRSSNSKHHDIQCSKLFHSQFIHSMLNNRVHVEGLYRMIRIDPSVLQQLLVKVPSDHYEEIIVDTSCNVSSSKRRSYPRDDIILDGSSLPLLPSLPTDLHNDQQNEEEEKTAMARKVSDSSSGSGSSIRKNESKKRKV